MIEVAKVAGGAVVDRVVLAGHGVHAIDTNLLQHLACLPELLGLRQMADVAGVHDECGRPGQRMNVRDRMTETADDIGVRVLAKADVRIADLDEGERIGVARHRRAAFVAPSARGTPPATVHATAAPLQPARQVSAWRRVSLRAGSAARRGVVIGGSWRSMQETLHPSRSPESRVYSRDTLLRIAREPLHERRQYVRARVGDREPVHACSARMRDVEAAHDAQRRRRPRAVCGRTNTSMLWSRSRRGVARHFGANTRAGRHQLGVLRRTVGPLTR